MTFALQVLALVLVATAAWRNHYRHPSNTEMLGWLLSALVVLFLIPAPRFIIAETAFVIGMYEQRRTRVKR